MYPILFRFHLSFYVLTGTLLLTTFLGLSAQPALAHARIEVGPYVIIVGWVEEPVIVGERNAILIEVSENEEPVVGLEGSLDVNVLYAGRTFIGNLTPSSSTPGLYTVEIFPTVRGTYSVQLSGTIGDLALDELVEPEEVLSPGVLQFPEVQPELTALQSTVDELEARLQTAYTLAIAGLVAGIIGGGVAVVALVRRPKQA